MNNEWVTEQYPIPVITVNQLGDIGIDLEHYFLELVLTRSQALNFDFNALSSYQFEVYGMEVYLNDFYNENIPLESIRTNILKSKELQIGVSIYFNKDEDLSVLSNSIREISDCIVTESKLKSEYINAPCKTSSLPYWKTKVHSLPDHMKVIIEKDYNKELFHEYLDEPYFKLIHRLENIKEEPDNKQYSIQIVNGITELDSVVAFINECYQHISVTLEQVKRWMQEAVNMTTKENNPCSILYLLP